MPTIFSAGWIAVLLVILGYCVVRIVQKGRTIHEGDGMGGGPVRILGQAGAASVRSQPQDAFDSALSSANEMYAQGRVNDALAACETVLASPAIESQREHRARATHLKGLCLRAKGAGGEQGALLKAAEVFRQALALTPPSMFPELHARIQCDLGETYLAQAGEGHRRERLLAAARAFYSGAEVAGGKAPGLKADLMIRLGGAYEQMAGEKEDETALRRACVAYGESIRLLADQAQAGTRASALVRLGDVSARLGRKGHREDMERAAKAYRLALKDLPRNDEAFERTVAALADVERALRTEKEP